VGVAGAPPFRACFFFAFLPFFEITSSGSDASVRDRRSFWEVRIYHPGRRDGIMDGMRFHDPSRVPMAFARRDPTVACAGGRDGREI
jgi:hypothetical protein